jgi:prophage maintenance system killer protein
MLNGEDLEATKEEKYLTFLRVADGSVSDEELADWIRSHSRADTGEEDAEPTVDGP